MRSVDGRLAHGSKGSPDTIRLPDGNPEQLSDVGVPVEAKIEKVALMPVAWRALLGAASA